MEREKIKRLFNHTRRARNLFRFICATRKSQAIFFSGDDFSSLESPRNSPAVRCNRTRASNLCTQLSGHWFFHLRRKCFYLTYLYVAEHLLLRFSVALPLSLRFSALSSVAFVLVEENGIEHTTLNCLRVSYSVSRGSNKRQRVCCRMPAMSAADGSVWKTRQIFHCAFRWTSRLEPRC